MVKLARDIEPVARALRQQYEDTVEAPLNKGGEILAAAHFAVEGTKSYPDATFTLRLNFGQVKGWSHNGKMVDPCTTTRRRLCARHRRTALRAAGRGSSQGQAGSEDAVQLLLHQRHHRRQLRLAGDQRRASWWA